MKQAMRLAIWSVFLIMIMTTLTNAQVATDYFFGELAQWPFVKADTVGAQNGTIQSLKATQTEQALYLHLKMPEPAAKGTFYLEIESNSPSYGGRGLWGDQTAISHKVENGTLYKYKGTGTDEAWQKVGPAEIKLLPEGLVVRIDFGLLGFSAPQPLKVAYYLNGLDYLPMGGSTMLQVSRRIFTDETGVYEQEFWDSRSTAAHTSEMRIELQAIRDHQKLFVLVKGKNLNTRNTYWIKTADVEGYTHPLWPDSTINYKVDAGILYEYNKTDEQETWAQVAPVYTYITDEALVMSVDLALLGADSTSQLSLAYTNSKEQYLPLGHSSLFAVNALIEQPLKPNTFYPLEYHGTMNNPFKGWAPDSLGGPYKQPHRLVRTQMIWSEIEPLRGQYDWETFERKNKFEYWDSLGVSYVIRFRMDVPSKRTADHMEIPRWLYEMIDGDGTLYNNSEIGSGFSPNYENPILIAEHERLIKAIGERYNSDPRVAFIQLGSIGHWGEWHTWPEGSGVFPVEEVANQYMKHYVEYLDQKMLGIRRPFAFARENNFGFFNDRIGYAQTTEDWLFWINNGMDYNDWYNKQVYPDAAVPDFWQTAYSAGEFGSGNALLWLTDETIVETLRQVRLSHTSWIGPCSPAGLTDIPEVTNLNALLQTIGYRYVIESVTHDRLVVSGRPLVIEMVWHNKGVAPIYFSWPLKLGLVDLAGNLVLEVTTDVDIRTWLPGRSNVKVMLDIPQSLPAGSYTLVASIHDPSTSNPGIDLAISGRRSDGRYTLSTIEISE